MTNNYAPTFTTRVVEAGNEIFKYALCKAHKDCNDIIVLQLEYKGTKFLSRRHYYKPCNYAAAFKEIQIYHGANLPESVNEKIKEIINHLKIYE